MKKIQVYRFGVQAICLVLTVVGFFLNYKVTMLVIMGLTIIGGAFYCGWVCPYGFIQDIASSLGKILGIKKRKMPRIIQNVLVFSRYIVFVLVTILTADLIFSIMSLDPRSNFENLLSGNAITAAIIGVMFFFILIALFFDRPFCNYLCYEGAKNGLMSSFRIFTIKRNKSKCVNCKKCDKVCPMNIQVSTCSDLRSPQCINCFQCVSSCPVKGALGYGKMNDKKKMLTIIAVAIVLISGYIMYNILSGINPLDKNKTMTSNETQVTTSENSKSTDESTLTTNQEAESTESTTITEPIAESVKNSGDAAGIADGVYSGEGKGFRGTMTVDVTVKDQQIVSVDVVDNVEDQRWFDRANNSIPSSIVESQSTDVDLVSGATYSSIGIRDAVIDALSKAK